MALVRPAPFGTLHLILVVSPEILQDRILTAVLDDELPVPERPGFRIEFGLKL
jgi:hypothetical protein